MTSMQKFNCIFCKEVFENKEELQIHFRKHGDPKFNQSQKGKSRPSNEDQSSVETKKDNVEMVSCDVCPEMFPTISKAITHKHKVHPDHDVKYFCPWCGKLFTMKHLYNKHIQSNHENIKRSDNMNFHCDPCNTDFYIPSAMMYHNKFLHRLESDLYSFGQSKKLKTYHQEVLPIYYCAFCGDEYENKVNLYKHLTDDHGDENQSPEDVLRCPLCEAIFYHLDAYEVHLTFHSTDDLYGEVNEMFEQITEFSLETVAPIMEKVGNVEAQDVESTMNAVGIDKFLELAMDSSLDNDNGTPKSKSKKHKKHKKKNKEAITLDEFLSMNKDVFGEGIDFQGIEEVPTQVVTKRLKQKKAPVGNLKVVPSNELKKLQMQGIVVKMKPRKVPSILRTAKKYKHKAQAQIVNKPPVQNTTSPDEVLSKLINQTNNQIKIVKKGPQDNSDTEPQTELALANTIPEKDIKSPESVEVKCDVNMESRYTSSENVNKESIKKPSQNNEEVAKFSTDNKLDDQCNKSLENVDTTRFQEETGNDVKISDINNCDSIFDKSVNKNEGDNMGVVHNQLTNNTGVNAEDSHKNNEDEKVHKNVVCEKSDSSLNALKHLSHLITVKSVPAKKSFTPIPAIKSDMPIPQQNTLEQKGPIIKQSHDGSDEDEINEEQNESNVNTAKNIKESKLIHDSMKSLNSIQKLSKNITIKPVTHSPKVPNELYEEEQSDSEAKTHSLLSKTIKSTSDKEVCSKDELTSKTFKSVPKDKSNSQEQFSKINLLKHLSNVTAKPANSMKSNHQQISSKTAVNETQNKNISQNVFKKEKEMNQEIEIFNIDDSDDEPATAKDSFPLTIQTNNPKPTQAESTLAKPLNTLKNISKNVTIKQFNQQPHTIKKNISKQSLEDKQSLDKNQCSDFSDEEDDENTLIPANSNSTKHKIILQNQNIKNTLRNLGKHITVKSGIPSPSSSIKSGKDQNSMDNYHNDDAGDSDDSYSGRVKITEITKEKDTSPQNESEEELNQNNNSEYYDNFTANSPGGSNNGFEHVDEYDDDDDLSDLEHQIKANTVKKPTPNINSQIVHLKNNNKNITIKSLGNSSNETDIRPKTGLPKVNNALSIKPFKPIKESADKIETTTNKKCVNTAQIKRSIINQNQSFNQNLSVQNQQNTVNKEVTVQTKTFQTKTVIQEITTTVTKTIKTVNQTVKQEVQQKQSSFTKFQKVQGMKEPSKQLKNFQGVTVRHATPALGTKIRGGAPGVGGAIRPSNQLVPVRPSQNTARMSVPRMPAVKRNMTNQPRPVNRPVKVSPSATTKRPTEEPLGHFSCFKKPKESLIPVSEIPSFSNDDNDSNVQYSSQTKTNTACTTKSTRGNTVVTQMKAEVSSSSHLEKLSSMSGLKIVKTSHSKQTMKVEEKCEMSPSQRNTLEAIEKLQKQGLLVKKPRVEVSNESDHSDEGTDYITEEPDD